MWHAAREYWTHVSKLKAHLHVISGSRELLYACKLKNLALIQVENLVTCLVKWIKTSSIYLREFASHTPISLYLHPH